MTTHYELPPEDADEYVSRLLARGIVLRLDGNALDVSGPVSPLDEDQIREHARSLVAALRRRERNAEPPAQPDGCPAPPVAPTAPEPPAVRFEPPPRLSVEGEPVTELYVLGFLRELDDDALVRYRSGELSKPDAYAATAEWMRDHLSLFGRFPRT